MSERPATCVRLLVEGRAQLQFFQVLLIATDSFDAARLAARRFLEVNGAQLVSFDEEETAIIQTGGVQEEFFFPVPTPEGRSERRLRHGLTRASKWS